MDAPSATLIFAEPRWFVALLLLGPLFLLRLFRHYSRSAKLPGLVSPRLRGQLITGGGEGRRWTVFALRSAALALIIVALARPQFGFDEVETETESRNLLVAIDTSRSMLAGDIPPDRLSRAKLAATDIIRSFPDDRIGLIAFAGKPFLQAPLTADHEAILEAIDQLDTEIIPRGGTNLGAAVMLALETFDESQVEHGAVVLFSDGEGLEGESTATKSSAAAEESGIPVFTVGVGTAAGAIIPELDETGQTIPGEFVRDESGQVVRTRLESAPLVALAGDPNRYLQLGGATSLTGVVSSIRKQITASREAAESRLRPRERFAWPASLALFFLIVAHAFPGIRGKRALSTPASATAVITLLLSVFSEGVLAEDPLFAGQSQFESGEYESAIQTYEGALAEGAPRSDRTRLRMGIGASAYRMGDFERATEAFGSALSEADEANRSLAHYNLGNTLFRKGEATLGALSNPANPDAVQSMAAPNDVLESTIATWENAVEHFESALSVAPDDPKARHNLEVVQKKIDELKKKQEEEKQKQEEQEQQQEEQEKDDKEEEQEQDEKEEENDQQEQEQDESQEDESQSQDQQDQSENQDQNPPGEEDPQPGDDNQPDQSPDEKDAPPEDDGESGPDDSPKENDPKDSGEQDEQKGNQPPPEPEPPTDAPPEGDISADPQQQDQPPGQSGSSSGAQNAAPVDPETGYSPTEARQLLDALADETEVRPILKPSPAERFKNW